MNRRISIILTSLVVVGVFAWVHLRPHEPPDPVYKGKPLSYWLVGFKYGNESDVKVPGEPTFEQARDAIRAAGTNALPLLLRWLRAKDSPLRLGLGHLAQRQHFIKFNLISASERHAAAVWGFVILGLNDRSHLTNAVPALIQIYNENVSARSQNSTMRVFAIIGPDAAEAVPVLLPSLTNSSIYERGFKLQVLGQIHSRPDLCVPAIAKLLNDSDANVRGAAVEALAKFGLDTNLQPRNQVIVPLTDLPASPTNAVGK